MSIVNVGHGSATHHCLGQRQRSLHLLTLFANAFGVSFAFNLVDWLLLDWLLFCLITP